ncbi:MAG: hypothetical protein ACRD50_10810 [Candidatus Acidiferrales bacterium]
MTFVVGYAAGVAAGEPFGNTVGSITAGLIVGAATCVTLNFLLHRPLKSTVSGTSPSDSPLPPNRMSTIFKRIETQRDALRATHWASAGFYSLAAIHLALGLLDPLYLFSETCAAVLYGVFAGLLSTLKSRVVAWIALAFTALNVILTLAEMATQRRLCCWYLLIQVWASIRAVQGTSGWHKLSPPRTGSTLPAVVSIGRSVVAGCFGLIGVFWVLGATGYLTGKLVAPIKLSFSATVAVNTMLLVGGALNGLVAAAIYNLRSWGRYLAIAMCGCFLSGLIFMFLLHLQLPRELVIGDVIFAVVGTLTLVWVFLPSVKAAFRFNN